VSDYAPAKCPVTFWDVFGAQGHPVRATISDMGPVLLARLLNLNDTQAGVLQLVFKIADDNGLLLLDLKDLRAMIQYVGENAKTFTTEYGNVSAASIGAIQRGLLTLGEQGGEVFFGEPMLDIADLMQTDDGKGVVNILAGDKLMASPRLYSTFLLWLLSELFEQLPEVGDLDKPKLVFFFDEAHLLFNEAPAALLEKIEQVVRLIRSKGVGVYFVTQNPLDIPDTVLGQLGNRVQHALRAFTPRDQKAVKAAAQTCGRIRSSMPRRRSPNSASARRWFPSSTSRAGRRRRACLHPAAGVAHRPADGRGAAGGDQEFGDLRALREHRRSRVGLRKAQGSPAAAAPNGGTPAPAGEAAPTATGGGWLGG
jgi:DNA helicase HerA-like ATPase